MGETMTNQIKHDSRYPVCETKQRIQDVFIVSSFTLWATVLGLAPILTYRMLLG
jgi:hypothetical protein